jgi:hypothetical protein
METELIAAGQNRMAGLHDADDIIMKRLTDAQFRECKTKTLSAEKAEYLDSVEPGLSKEVQDEVKNIFNKQIYDKTKEIKKLQQYNNPTAHFRMAREEVKQAAIDGKKKLQFPTGETAMKIEGLGDGYDPGWWRILEKERVGNELGVAGADVAQDLSNIKVGQMIFNRGDEKTTWIITKVLGDGKFKAVHKNVYESASKARIIEDTKPNGEKVWIVDNGSGARTPYGFRQSAIMELDRFKNIERLEEQFDISGKVDTSNPIYRFYEKDMGKYLRSKYNAKLITDEQGVKWWEVDVDPKYKKMPIEAFGLAAMMGAGAYSQSE